MRNFFLDHEELFIKILISIGLVIGITAPFWIYVAFHTTIPLEIVIAFVFMFIFGATISLVIDKNIWGWVILCVVGGLYPVLLVSLPNIPPKNLTSQIIWSFLALELIRFTGMIAGPSFLVSLIMRLIRYAFRNRK